MRKIFYLFIIFVAPVCLGSEFVSLSGSVLREYAATGWSDGYPVCEKLLAQYNRKREYCVGAQSFTRFEESNVKWDDFQTHCDQAKDWFTEEDSLIDYLGQNLHHMAALVRVAEGLKSLGGEYASWAPKAYAFLNERTQGLKEMCAQARLVTSESGYPAMFTQGGNMGFLTHHLLHNKTACEQELASIQVWSEDVWYIGMEAIEFHRDKMRRSKCCQQQVQS